MQWVRWFIFWGRKTMPSAYFLDSGSSKANTSLKKSCGMSISIPAPSPVLPSALTAPRCSSFTKISSALCMISLVLSPLRLQIKPAPQLSCSFSGWYKPCGMGNINQFFSNITATYSFCKRHGGLMTAQYYFHKI